jgi:hypothetical protein
MLVLFPVAGHAATKTTNTASKSVSKTTITKTATAGSQGKASEVNVAADQALAADRKLIGKQGTRTFGGEIHAIPGSQATPGKEVPAVKTNEKVRSGEAKGEVLQVRGGTNGQIGIATVANDIYFILDPAARLTGISTLEEIRRGDTVKVLYEETYLKGDKNLYQKRVVKEITFLKKKPSEPVKIEPAAEEKDET